MTNDHPNPIINRETSFRKALMKFYFCVYIIVLDPYFNFWRPSLSRRYNVDADTQGEIKIYFHFALKLYINTQFTHSI